MIAPVHLAVFYPHEPTIAWQKRRCTSCLIIITVLAIRTSGRRPYLLAGWLWYVISLLPVIGIVQVGSQALADRYTYIPSVGIGFMLCWGLEDLIRGLRYRKLFGAAAGTLALTTLFILTCKQVGYWKNSTTLFSNAVAVTKNNWYAYNNLANSLAREGKVNDALSAMSKRFVQSAVY